MPSVAVLNLLLFGCTNGVKLHSSFLGSIIYNILTKPGFSTVYTGIISFQTWNTSPCIISFHQFPALYRVNMEMMQLIVAVF